MTTPQELKNESIKLSPTGAWIWLVDIQLNAADSVKITDYDSTVTFNGADYQPIPFVIGNRQETTDNNPSELQISELDNRKGDWDDLFLNNQELVDKTITLHFGHTSYTGDPTKWITTTLVSTGSSRDFESCSISISPATVFGQSVPGEALTENNCRRTYRDGVCRYTAQVKTITDATNASPIEIETDGAHRFKDGATVVITGVTGNTAANGTFVLTVTGRETFTLNGSTGSGAYISGGEATVDLPTCDKTFYGENGCLAHNNPKNFGGNPCPTPVV